MQKLNSEQNNSMAHYSPSEADSNSSDEEICHLLWIPKFHFFAHQNQQLDPI
jgi:hypothetical protein